MIRVRFHQETPLRVKASGGGNNNPQGRNQYSGSSSAEKMLPTPLKARPLVSPRVSKAPEDLRRGAAPTLLSSTLDNMSLDELRSHLRRSRAIKAPKWYVQELEQRVAKKM